MTTGSVEHATAAEIARRVDALAALRRTAAASAARIKAAREAFERTYAVAIGEAKRDAAVVEVAETALRAIVAEHYKATKDKKPTAGVEIKLRTTLEYSADTAFEWARQTKMALVPESLDVKAFEKIAKATPLPFVKTVEEPMVTIATDLDKALSVAALTSSESAIDRTVDPTVEGAEP